MDADGNASIPRASEARGRSFWLNFDLTVGAEGRLVGSVALLDVACKPRQDGALDSQTLCSDDPAAEAWPLRTDFRRRVAPKE